ncbi:Fungal lipase-like domain [Dillenia turbinata]|uniref:Fungal lipase-like domain n=1 Tax=Dillenia turbinata TaxID=194707 RepID=A0AAN8Z0Q9_9MAGN
MSSEQIRRYVDPVDGTVVVERERVPKMATHFESLGKDDDKDTQFESLADKVKQEDKLGESYSVGKFETEENRGGKQRNTEASPSLQEIENYRQAAQQKSMEAIRAAEEKYEKAKEKLREAKDSATGYDTEKGARAEDQMQQGLSATSEYVSEKTGTAKEKTGAVKDTAVEKSQQAKEKIQQGVYIAKDTAVEKGQQAKEKMQQGISTAKDTAVEKGQQAVKKSQQAGKTAAQYIGERAGEAKDTAVNVTKNVAYYAGETAVAAKDRAEAAGWTAAHYTTEKAAEATKAAADISQKVAGYAGEKAVAAKDAVTGAGQTAMEYAEKPVSAAKETVVGTGKRFMDYTARKRAEAEEKLHAKGSTEWKEESGGESEFLSTGAAEGHEGGSSGGVLGAIGETLVEIARTTKEMGSVDTCCDLANMSKLRGLVQLEEPFLFNIYLRFQELKCYHAAIFLGPFETRSIRKLLGHLRLKFCRPLTTISMQSGAQDTVVKADEETSITIIGHRLGAALATLNAADIAANGYKMVAGLSSSKESPVTVFACSSPGLGDSNFHDACRAMKHLHILRVKNVPDVIPDMPSACTQRSDSSY